MLALFVCIATTGAGSGLLSVAITKSVSKTVAAAAKGTILSCQRRSIQQGEIEMGTYARVENEDGSAKLVKRNSTVVRPGQVQVYLPGDIHDTRCLTGPALLFRFTERDLKKEDEEEHRVTRYVERDGVWTSGAS